MLSVASKLLPLFLFPVGIVLTLGFLGLLARFLGWRRTSGGLQLASLLLLVAFASPMVAHALLRGLEGPYRQSLEFPKASAIVVLGGAGVPGIPPRSYPETNAFADRIFHGARLYRLGQAPIMVVTGGKIPFLKDSPVSEASINAALLGEMLGVGGDTLLLADSSRNTREDALYVKSLLERRDIPKDILLVTSAAHMPRAAAVFRKQGFTVHEAPTDFHADASFDFKLFNFLPREGCLYECWYALHEYYGLAAYRVFGWI